MRSTLYGEDNQHAQGSGPSVEFKTFSTETESDVNQNQLAVTRYLFLLQERIKILVEIFENNGIFEMI